MGQDSLCSQPIGWFFFTLRLRDSSSNLLVERIDVLRAATRLCLKRWPTVIDAAVVLPNRLHMIWLLPPNDLDHARRWRLIRSTFARHVAAPPVAAQMIWQRDVWYHAIRDRADLDLHRHLIATAPVTAGLVRQPGDWPYGSLQQRRSACVRTTDPFPSSPDQAVAATAM
jgi:putative transposase